MLQAELGARHSFREAARILETFLPCAKQHNTTVRNRLGKVAKDITDAEPLVCETLSSNPLTVFIDGAHIRCRPEYQKRHLDVVVGKIETRDMCRRFGLAPQAASWSASQLRRQLDAVGWDDRRPITVISDGEVALPNLLRGATKGKVRHILDWWHISMRIQHVENAIKGLCPLPTELKVDQAFVRNMDRERDCAVVVKMSILLAHELGIEVVVEGVEKKQVWSTLCELGCDRAQGFWMARPMTSEALGAFLNEPQSARRTIT